MLVLLLILLCFVFPIAHAILFAGPDGLKRFFMYKQTTITYNVINLNRALFARIAINMNVQIQNNVYWSESLFHIRFIAITYNIPDVRDVP